MREAFRLRLNCRFSTFTFTLISLTLFYFTFASISRRDVLEGGTPLLSPVSDPGGGFHSVPSSPAGRTIERQGALGSAGKHQGTQATAGASTKQRQGTPRNALGSVGVRCGAPKNTGKRLGQHLDMLGSTMKLSGTVEARCRARKHQGLVSILPFSNKN